MLTILMITATLWGLGLVLSFFLVFPFVTVLLSRFSSEKQLPKPSSETDFGCIITAYKNADIAIPLVQSLLMQRYQNIHIYLVADQCDVSNFDLTDARFTLLRPASPLNLKVKSIIHAVENYVRPHTYTAVFDADNVAHPQFLHEMNRYASAGCRSIQGQRTAKNLDTTFAAADAIGEFYKNYIERYVTYLLGSSSVISGSGMAVETSLYKTYLYGEEITRGKELWKKMMQEDKILQNHLLGRRERIVYAWNAVVYDEKVTSADQVETQRSRWLFSYFQNLPNSLGFVMRGLFTFNFNQLLFGLVTVSPPLFILLGMSGVVGLLSLFLDWGLAALMIGSVAVFVGTIFWALYLSKVPDAVWSGLRAIPAFILRQATALVGMRNPNKNFKHSEHTRTLSIEDILNDRKTS